REDGPDAGQMVVLRPQPLEVCPPQRIDQIVGQPSGAALVTPGGAVEPPLVEAGEDQTGVDRLAGCPQLHHDAGGLDTSPDSLRDEFGGGTGVDLTRRGLLWGPASHESRAEEQYSMQHSYARRRRYPRGGAQLSHRVAYAVRTGTTTATLTARQPNDSATSPPLRMSVVRWTPLMVHW